MMLLLTHRMFISIVALRLFAWASGAKAFSTGFRAINAKHCASRKSALHARSQNSNDEKVRADDKRRSLFGLVVPLAIAVSANAPSIALILNPPTSKEREEMITEWCKTDYCTLLQGGAGFVSENSSSAVGGDYNSDLVLPSLEEYAEQARLEAKRTGLDM